MPDECMKEIKEVYTIKEIDRNLPTIIYQKTKQHDMTKFDGEYYSISDETSEKALHTLKELKKVMK